MKVRGGMTSKQFTDLLKDYLTDPVYAKVRKIDDRSFSVKLDGGERFRVRVTVPAG
jgi:hypothetical protein